MIHYLGANLRISAEDAKHFRAYFRLFVDFCSGVLANLCALIERFIIGCIGYVPILYGYLMLKSRIRKTKPVSKNGVVVLFFCRFFFF